ncbi:hypothetical protein M0805_002254 [Coniferiporia weirii]|nr:hypothetical protein M0805_002254 [Coniferiporia weirii]
MEDIVSGLGRSSTNWRGSQTRKSEELLDSTQTQLTPTQVPGPRATPSWTTYNLKNLKFKKKGEIGDNTTVETKASCAIVGQSDTGKDMAMGSKFANLGLTQYNGLKSKGPRDQRNPSAPISQEKKKACRENSCADMQGAGVSGNRGSNASKKSKMKGKTRASVVVVSDVDENVSSDDINITDASGPIESPVKVVHLERSQRSSCLESGSGTDSSVPARTNNKGRKGSQPEPRPKSKSKLKEGREMRSAIGTTARRLGNGKGKDGKPLAMVGNGARSINVVTTPETKAKVNLGKRGAARPKKNPIQALKEEEDGLTPRASRTAGNQGKKKPIRPSTKVKRKPAPFPMKECAATPSPGSITQQKGKSRVEDEDSNSDPLSMKDTDEILNRGGPRPFPMTSQDFACKPPSSSSVVSGSTKRSSESDDEHGPSKRRRKSNRMSELYDLGNFSFTQPEERPDPNTLCPYCDMPFPTDPSPLLTNMVNRIRKISYRDPRPSNALGLKAPLLSYVNMCQRHQFEATLLPQARAKGWPTYINFTALPVRVKALKSQLESYMLNKESSLFWLELKKEIDKKGVRRVMGISDQFNTFEKSQPGYYGEQGSVIIYQTLYSLFPVQSIDARRVAPLTPTEFIQRVLVPEAATALVQEDMGFDDKGDAVRTLRESSKFGTAMFPDMDSCEGEGARGGGGDVGETMVRERARARRKEIEEEDRIDEELEELEREKIRREATRTKGKGRCVESDRNDRDDKSEVEVVERPTGNTTKAGRTTAWVSDSSSEIVELSDSSVAQTDSSNVGRSRMKGKTAELFEPMAPPKRSRNRPLSRKPDVAAVTRFRSKHNRVVDTTSDSDVESTPKPLSRIQLDQNIVPPKPDSRYKNKSKAAGTAESVLPRDARPLEAVRRKKASSSDGFVFTMRDSPSPSSDDDVEVQDIGIPLVTSNETRRRSQSSNAWLLSDDSIPDVTSP